MRLLMLRNIKPTRKCRRCGLRYPVRSEQCIHCAQLDEAGLAELKAHIQQQYRANAGLGRLLIYAAGLIALALVVMLAA